MKKMNRKKVGILSLQGSFVEHKAAVEKMGHRAYEIRTLADAKKSDPQALIIPGGESTTMIRILDDNNLLPWLINSIKSGLPVLATCAGVILLSRSHLNLLDIDVERNAYGRQLDSFETNLLFPLLTKEGGRGGDQKTSAPLRAIFIRAPKIRRVGPHVQILAEVGDGNPVLVQQNNILAATFHPELTEDLKIYKYFLCAAKQFRLS